MLLIWDIHITSKHKDRIIQELKAYIDSHPTEQNIIFLGDYVYHFSYDRAALLALYHFFVELFEQGKSIYILSGNHDRLGNSFVFEEAQKAFTLIEKYNKDHQGKLHFITQPTHKEIEWQSIIFFPFMLQIPETQLTQEPIWLQKISYLQDSNNKNEQISWKVNQSLATMLEKHPNSTVIHHYYFNKTKLPGQKSQFSYKDIALNEEILDIPNTQLISGHLHQACSFKNYLCTGSIWSSSPLENNQEKFLFQYTPVNQTFTANPIRINPYIQIEFNWQISQNYITNIIQQQNEQSKTNFIGNQNIQIKNSDFIPFQYISLTIIGEQLQYENIENYINQDTLNQIQRVQLKKQTTNTNELLEKLQTSSINNESFGNRKQLLKDYLAQKYKDEFNEYESLLQELKVL